MTTIRVTRTHADGHIDTWTQDGADEAAHKARFRNHGVTFRHGTGWLERDHDGWVERIDWVDGQLEIGGAT